MFIQLLIVGLLVALSALYVGRQTWRTWFGKKGEGCGGGCGCAAKPRSAPSSEPTELITINQLTMRLRQRPR